MKKSYLSAISAITLAALSMTACGSTAADTTEEVVEESVDTAASEETVEEAADVEESAETETTEEAETAETPDLVFGTVNLPYADFYYGEINGVEGEIDATTAQTDVADVVEAAGLEGEGMYDAVTSATNQKSTRFEQTYYEEDGEGVNILGVANVNVAISPALYEDVQARIEAGEECANPLFDLVSEMTVTETVPAEYKVINSDGTLSKTVGTTTVAEGATASFTSVSVWGNYQFSVEGVELDAATVQGALIETSDGAIYGLEHEDNLWLQAGEVSFAVVPFTEPHGNEVAYERFADLQGKTITKLTYMIANGDDIEITTDAYVNLQLEDGYGITGDEEVTYSADGTSVNYELNVPEDSSYELTSVSCGRTPVDMSTVTIEDGVITLDADNKAGSYSFVFEDATYAGVKFTTLVDSGLTESDITFNSETNTFDIDSENITAIDYVTNLASVTVDGEPVEGKGLSAILFDENGVLLLDAEVGDGDATAPVFAEGASHEVTIESTGYPSVTFTVER